MFRTMQPQDLPALKALWCDVFGDSADFAQNALWCTEINLRNLFARTFYRASRDVALLADVLGHSSIETTRVYLVSSGAEYAKRLNRLGLILWKK